MKKINNEVVKMRDFYWSFCMLLTMQLVILCEISKQLYIGIFAIIIFIAGLIISHMDKLWKE